MKIEHEKSPEREYQKEIASRWRKRFDDALDAVIADTTSGQKEFLDVLWAKGILEHMSPSDAEERHARKELGKAVWERDDHELYLRAMYSALHTKQTANKTLVNGYVTAPALQALGHMSMGETRSWVDFFPEVKTGIEKNILILMADAIASRAVAELKERGGQTIPVSIGAEGQGDGIGIRVTGYSGTGEIETEPIRFEDGWNMKRRRIPPTELDPDDFKLPHTTT